MKDLVEIVSTEPDDCATVHNHQAHSQSMMRHLPFVLHCKYCRKTAIRPSEIGNAVRIIFDHFSYFSCTRIFSGELWGQMGSATGFGCGTRISIPGNEMKRNCKERRKRTRDLGVGVQSVFRVWGGEGRVGKGEVGGRGGGGGSELVAHLDGVLPTISFSSGEVCTPEWSRF